MAQKTIAQSRPGMRAFNQAGDVSHYKRAKVAKINNAEMRLKRCKWIIGDLWLGR
jgi:hypothetical protein